MRVLWTFDVAIAHEDRTHLVLRRQRKCALSLLSALHYHAFAGILLFLHHLRVLDTHTDCQRGLLVEFTIRLRQVLHLLPYLEREQILGIIV